ncbi:MAG: CoA pyrophosphatase [Robiginitomaculum sp.]|nr:CoA pyrophosphatase [Robiginitomaculum sp.]
MIELLSHVLDKTSLSTSQTLYSDYDLNPDDNKDLSKGRAAAVLLPLVFREDGWQIIMTVRSQQMPTHAGQISFPGGGLAKMDKSLSDTALRECEEETGILRSQVNLLGEFEPYHTVTNYRVTPFVGIVEGDIQLRADPAEVAEIFEVPFSFVTELDNFRRDSRQWQGVERFFYAVPYKNRYIWGATAGILRALALRLSNV